MYSAWICPNSTKHWNTRQWQWKTTLKTNYTQHVLPVREQDHASTTPEITLLRTPPVLFVSALPWISPTNQLTVVLNSISLIPGNYLFQSDSPLAFIFPLQSERSQTFQQGSLSSVVHINRPRGHLYYSSRNEISPTPDWANVFSYLSARAENCVRHRHSCWIWLQCSSDLPPFKHRFQANSTAQSWLALLLTSNVLIPQISNQHYKLDQNHLQHALNGKRIQ